MIRYDTRLNLKPLDGAIQVFADYDAFDIVQGIVEDREPLFCAQMQSAEPGRVKRPIQWTSEKQRRAFFATNGFGGGIPYRRTGGLSRAWNMSAEGSADTVMVRINNEKRAARFVYGSLAQSRASRLRFQQQFHRNTGWPDAYGEYVQPETEEVVREFKRRSTKWFDQVKVISTGRATTPRLRR